jgi:hypothetical protein
MEFVPPLDPRLPEAGYCAMINRYCSIFFIGMTAFGGSVF